MFLTRYDARLGPMQMHLEFSNSVNESIWIVSRPHKPAVLKWAHCKVIFKGCDFCSAKLLQFVSKKSWYFSSSVLAFIVYAARAQEKGPLREPGNFTMHNVSFWLFSLHNWGRGNITGVTSWYASVWYLCLPVFHEILLTNYEKHSLDMDCRSAWCYSLILMIGWTHILVFI